MATKTIKLIKPWRLHPIGAVITPDVPVANLLIERGAAMAIETSEVAGKIKKRVK